LLAKISPTVSEVQERCNKYAYRTPSPIYGTLLSIDFLVCIFGFQEKLIKHTTGIAQIKAHEKEKYQKIQSTPNLYSSSVEQPEEKAYMLPFIT